MFRKARHEDREAVLEWIKEIWDGDDYIPDIFDEWVDDPQGAFILMEVDGEVVGLTKMTQIDAQKVWFEGIRVAKAHRGKGYGKKLAAYQLDKAREMEYTTIQLATYRLNESIGIVEADGYRKIATFKYAELRPGMTEITDEPAKVEKAAEFPHFAGFINLDFSFREMTPELMAVFTERGDLYRYRDSRFILTGYKAKGNGLSLVAFEGNPEAVCNGCLRVAEAQGVDFVSIMSGDAAWTQYLIGRPDVYRLDDVLEDVYLYEKGLVGEDAR